METMIFKKSVLKIVRFVISMAIKLEDFDIGNILIDEKSHETFI